MGDVVFMAPTGTPSIPHGTASELLVFSSWATTSRLMTDGWTPDAIKAIRGADGSAPVRTEIYRTADPYPPAEQSIRLIFADGLRRDFMSKRGGPWLELAEEPGE